jgi:tripartite-type tricarboxylate transporter receptor subunit TctC
VFSIQRASKGLLPPAVDCRQSLEQDNAEGTIMSFRTTAVSFAGAVVATILAALQPALAQDSYPSQPVRIVMSLPPGSAPDIRVRIIGNQLTTIWRRQVVVENRAGAGGALAVQAALAAPADGYTLLSTVSSVFTILPAQRDKLPFDVNRDLVPIALTGSEGMVLAVSSKLGVSNLAEFITLAKAQPNKLIIGTNPAGSLPHLAGRLFAALTKAPVTVVPYSSGGTNEAIREVLGGRIHGVIEARSGLQAQLDSGDLKALAIMARERVSTAPNVPIATETVPGLTAVGWSGIFAPRRVPDAIVQRLAGSLCQVLENPEIKTRLEQTGTPYRPLYTGDFARFIEAEQKLWWPVAKEAGPS